MTMAEIERLLSGVVEFAPIFDRCKEKAPQIFMEARNRLGLTQSALASKLGFHHTYISNVERGHVPPSVPILVELHRLLKENAGSGP